MTNEIEIPKDLDRAFFEEARRILGDGYVAEYYEQNAANSLRWAYRAGFDDGKRLQRLAQRRRRGAAERKARAK